MDEQTPDEWSDGRGYSEWDAGTRPTSRADRHAATMLWVVGGLQTLMYGFFAFRMLRLGLMSKQELRHLLPKGSEHSAELERLIKLHSVMVPSAIFMFVVLVLPALAVIGLGFRVRKGKQLANKTARIILYIQSFIAAMAIFISFLEGQASAILSSLVVFGSMLGILIAAARACLVARDADVTGPTTNPWDA